MVKRTTGEGEVFMFLLKRKNLMICGLIFAAIFQFSTAYASIETWLPVKLKVLSNNDQVDHKSFSVPVDVTVYWDCSLNGDKYAYGSFLIMDDADTVIVTADRLNGTRSGSFDARAGVNYTITASGNSGYDTNHTIHFGSVQGMVNYLYPYDWLIYDNSFTGVWKNSHLYLPEKISHTGQYSYDKNLALNKRSDLGVRGYDIPVWFQADIGGKPEVADLEIEPGIRIYPCNANGGIVQEPLKLNLMGYNRKKIDGFFILPANFGFLVDVNTGQYTFPDSKAAAGFVCHYKIEYILDNAPPNIPESPSPIRIDKVKNINGSFHTNLNPVELAWAVPQDNASSFKEKTVISGVKDYQVSIQDNLKNSATKSDWLNQPSVALSLEEGIYTIKVKARDNEGNESGFSEPFSLIVDRSVNKVEIQKVAEPIQLQHFNGTYNVIFTWEAVQDKSGIKYQVALTNTLLEPNGNWDVVDINKVVFYSRQVSDSTMYAYIRAIDGVGNISQWTHSDGFKIWTPQVSYSVSPSAVEVNNQSLYKIELTFDDVEATKYIIERVGSSVSRPVEITKQQLTQNGFKYTDTENLQKHGQYQYIVYTQNALGVNSEKSISSMVTLPNIPAPGTNIIIKDGNGRVLDDQGAISRNNNLIFELTPTQDIEGDEIRFKLYYKNLDLTNNQIFSFPGVLQTNPIAIKALDLNQGNYEFWMEYQEFSGNLPISELLSTPHRIFTFL